MMVLIATDQQSLVVEGITILDDTSVEEDEFFELSLGLPTSPTGVSLDFPSQTRVTIRDDEGA